MRSKIIILQTDFPGLGRSLTLIGYSSEFSEIADVNKLYQSYDLTHNDQLTPDTVSEFGRN